MLAKEFNKPDHAIIDHHTYVFMGDGCMMEGISHEAASLAGVWKLGKLVAFYDHNGISIDGDVRGWFKDNTAERFEAYGWNVIGGSDGIDGHDVEAVNAAINEALARTRATAKPTMIICRTIIGRGSPHRGGTAKAHGEALGVDEVAATRKRDSAGPSRRSRSRRTSTPRGTRSRPAPSARRTWNDKFAAYRKAYPEEAAELLRRVKGDRPPTWPATVDKLLAELRREEGIRSPRARPPAATRSRRSSRSCPNCSAARPT